MNRKEKNLVIIVYIYIITLILLLIGIFIGNVVFKFNSLPLIIIFIGFAVIFYIVILIYKYNIYCYRCPKCHKSFRPSFIKWLFSYRYGNHRKLACPCGNYDYMERILK